MGLFDFRFSQDFATQNISLDKNDRPRRYGKYNFNKLTKWRFYSLSDDQMMICVDKNENKSSDQSINRGESHAKTSLTKNHPTKTPTYMIFFMEE